MEKVRTQT